MGRGPDTVYATKRGEPRSGRYRDEAPHVMRIPASDQAEAVKTVVGLLGDPYSNAVTAWSSREL